MADYSEQLAERRQPGLKRLRREARVLYENYRLEKMFHDNVPLSNF